MTTPQTATTTDPQSMAALQQKLDAALSEKAALAEELAARTAELAQRNSEYGERIAHQSATIDVLRAMSASPGDPQPVFDLMVEHARSFCGADTSGIALAIDGTLYLRAHRGFSGNHASAYEASFPRPVSNDTNFGRTILARAVQQIPDNSIDPSFALATAARSAGVQSHAGVPLLRGGEPIGSLSIARKAPGNFTRTQMELLEIFAEQAVIAISSAEAYRAQKEALEQQTATAEVLQVINASPGNLMPVFDAILEKAHTLCGAIIGSLATYDGEYMCVAAAHGYPTDYDATSLPPVRPSPAGSRRLIDGDRFVHVPDMQELQPRPEGNFGRMIERTGLRTALMIPLRKDGAFVGQISAFRPEARPFAEREITLLENFAAQAVIAMENARLITEQREALEQQTATAEVLRVINTSPGNLGAVFDAMLEKALTLCGAEHGSLGTYDGDYFRAVASRGYPAAVLETLQGGFHGLENPVTRPLFDGARFVQIPDLGEIDHPIPKTIAALGGFRTVLFVPLRKDGKLLGHISASSPGNPPICGEGNHAAGEFRRPGGHRDGECSAAG